MTDVSFLWFANRASYRNIMSIWLFVEADVARIIAHLLSGAGSPEHALVLSILDSGPWLVARGTSKPADKKHVT